jgi:hypothetical protein
MRALATAFVAVFLCLQPASAQECTHPGVIAARAVASVPGARILEMLSGPEAHWVVQSYNEIEPVSTHFADHVAVIVAEGVPVVLLIAYTADNCTVFADQMPADMYRAIRGNGA